MALCLVVNKDLTVPFSDIGRQLRDHGEQIVWLSPSHRWTEWLLREGWPREDVLSIPEFAAEWHNLPAAQAAAQLQDAEREAPQTIGNIIRMCRSLSRYPPSFAYSYLAVVRAHVEPFLRERKVELVLGEGTWGFEQIIWLTCQRLGIPMLTPATTRIPADRFYFGDAVSSDLHSVASAAAHDRAWAEQFLPEWLNRPVQPEYMVQYSRGYTPLQKRWLGEFKTAVLKPRLDRDDVTLWPIEARIADRVRRMVNAQMFDWFRPYERELPPEKYVLYALHHQPEASVDVFGALNSNQEALIDSLSRLLPTSHKLWIKEHKGALGDRSLAWFQRVKKLPNVRLIDPFRDIYGLIRNASLVVTVSGTVGYEAALMGVPTVGLAPVYFSGLLTNRPTARSHPLEWQMREILSHQPSDAERAETTRRSIEFLAHLHANSFPGDPIDVEAPAERRNAPGYLRKEAEGFLAFLRALRGNAARLSVA
jgi:hypothetical protein